MHDSAHAYCYDIILPTEFFFAVITHHNHGIHQEADAICFIHGVAADSSHARSLLFVRKVVTLLTIYNTAYIGTPLKSYSNRRRRLNYRGSRVISQPHFEVEGCG